MAQRSRGFLVSKFKTLSASAAAVGGNLKFRKTERLPFALKYGKKSTRRGGHINRRNLISTQSVGKNAGLPKSIYIYEETEGKNYFGIEPRALQDDINTELQVSLSAVAYQQISKSFFALIGGGLNSLPVGEYAVTLAENGELASGSYDIIPRSQIIPLNGSCSFSNVNNFTNDTNAVWAFANTVNTDVGNDGQRIINITESIESWNFIFKAPDFKGDLANNAITGTASIGSASNVGFETNTVTNFSNFTSGQSIGRSRVRYYNPFASNQLDGIFLEMEIKGKIFGDSDTEVDGTGVGVQTFLPRKKLIIFPSNSIVESSSFRYHPSSISAATSSNGFADGVSTEFRTIFFISSAANPAYLQAFMINTGSFSGSHAYKDITLRTPADEGFYSWGGPTASFSNPIFVGKFDVNNPVLSSASGSEQSGSDINIVPRFSQQAGLFVDGQH